MLRKLCKIFLVLTFLSFQNNHILNSAKLQFTQENNSQIITELDRTLVYLRQQEASAQYLNDPRFSNLNANHFILKESHPDGTQIYVAQCVTDGAMKQSGIQVTIPLKYSDGRYFFNGDCNIKIMDAEQYGSGVGQCKKQDPPALPLDGNSQVFDAQSGHPSSQNRFGVRVNFDQPKPPSQIATWTDHLPTGMSPDDWESTFLSSRQTPLQFLEGLDPRYYRDPALMCFLEKKMLSTAASFFGGITHRLDTDTDFFKRSAFTKGYSQKWHSRDFILGPTRIDWSEYHDIVRTLATTFNSTLAQRRAEEEARNKAAEAERKRLLDDAAREHAIEEFNRSQAEREARAREQHRRFFNPHEISPEAACDLRRQRDLELFKARALVESGEFQDTPDFQYALRLLAEEDARRAEAFHREEAARRAFEERRRMEQEMEQRRMIEAFYIAQVEMQARAVAINECIKAAQQMPEESYFVTGHPELQEDMNLSDKKLEELAKTYDDAMSYLPGEKKIGSWLAKRLRSYAKDAIDLLRKSHTEYRETLLRDLKHDLKWGTGLAKYDSPRYSSESDCYSYNEWNRTRIMLQNPSKKNVYKFDLKASNLSAYYKNWPNTIKLISSLEQCEALKIQYDRQASIVKVMNDTDCLFYKLMIQPDEVNRNFNTAHTGLAIINCLSMTRAVDLSNRFDASIALLNCSADLLQTAEALASIINAHSSDFWNRWWFGKDFAQRLRSSIDQSSDTERAKVYTKIGAASDELAKTLKGLCDELPENKALFLQQISEIAALNEQRDFAQAGSNAVDLITTILSNAMSDRQKTELKIGSVNAQLKRVVSDEQKQAQGPIQEKFEHYKFFNPNTTTFIDSVLKAQKLISESPTPQEPRAHQTPQQETPASVAMMRDVAEKPACADDRAAQEKNPEAAALAAAPAAFGFNMHAAARPEESEVGPMRLDDFDDGDALPERPRRRRRTEPLDPSSSLLQGLPSQVGAPAADVGMEGPAADTQSGRVVPGNFRSYIAENERLAEELGRQVHDNPELYNACRFAYALNRFAELYVAADDGVGTQALAEASRSTIERVQRMAMHSVKALNPIPLFKLGLFLIDEIERQEEVDRAFASFNAEHFEQVSMEHAEHVMAQRQAILAAAKQTVERLKAMPWDERAELVAQLGLDLFVMHGAGKFTGAALKTFFELTQEFRTIAEIERTAAVAGRATPISEAGQSVAAVGKVAATDGIGVAEEVVETIARNPELLTPQTSVGQVIQEVTTEIKDPMGTVWDFIKMTDVMYDNTRIPRSFEIAVGSKKFWVHPNATKHMRDYLTKAIEISHDMPINSQTMLRSFKAAVEIATTKGIKFEQIIVVDCWELKFGAARQDGLLPCIFHADFRPRGF